MTRKRRIVPALFGGGLALPYTFDPSALGDGDLPGVWSGITYQIFGGAVVNTPTLGSELLTDGGLEANYTAGLCDTLTSGGSPVVSEEVADQHGGDSAQKFTAVALNNNLRFADVVNTPNHFYDVRVWAKLTAALSSVPLMRTLQSGGIANSNNYSETVWTQYGLTYRTPNEGNIVLYPIRDSGSSDFNTVIVDDCSVKAITFAETVAWLDMIKADVVIKVRPSSLFTYGNVGMILRANSNSSPTSFLLARWYRSLSGFGRAVLEQNVSGTWTVLVDSNVAYVADADFEVRVSGNTAQMFYNNSQVSTDQSINVGLASNGYIGMFETDGGSIDRFFVSGN